jgi:hypothetical protein
MAAISVKDARKSDEEGELMPSTPGAALAAVQLITLDVD